MCLLCCTSLRFFQLCSPHSNKSDPKSTETSKSCSQIQKFCQRNSSYSERKETSMIEGLQQLQGGSGGAEIWHRPQITLKSCDALHSNFSSCARRTRVKEIQSRRRHRRAAAKFRSSASVIRHKTEGKNFNDRMAAATPLLYQGRQRLSCALVHFTHFTSGPWK